MNVFDYIIESHDCEQFEPEPSEGFTKTSAPPGSFEKLEILRQRAEACQPLWHRDDRNDFSGCRENTIPRRKSNG